MKEHVGESGKIEMVKPKIETMNTIHITENKPLNKIKTMKPISGMHPGSGFVAWPDGKKAGNKDSKKRRNANCLQRLPKERVC